MPHSGRWPAWSRYSSTTGSAEVEPAPADYFQSLDNPRDGYLHTGVSSGILAPALFREWQLLDFSQYLRTSEMGRSADYGPGSTRTCIPSASRRGGAPKKRLYSRENCDALS